VRWNANSGTTGARAITRADTGSTVSGGFAVVQPGSQLSINAVEGFPLEDFSAEVSFRHSTNHLRRNGADGIM
jgi:hypothetical protein